MEDAAAVPPDAPLYASQDLDGSDVQVLAYRLRRAIPRTPAPDPLAVPRATRAPFAYVLLPVATADAQSDPRARRIATSSRRGTNVALIAVPSEGSE